MHRSITVLLLLVLATAGRTATIYVDNTLTASVTGTYSVANRDNAGSDGDGYTTIDAGLNAALPGDNVLVRDGIYREAMSIRVNGEAGNRITLANYPDESPIMEGIAKITGWEQCQADDPYLTVQGTVNPDYASIYRVAVADLPPQENANTTWIIQVYEDGEFMLPAQGPNQNNIIQNQWLYPALTSESDGLTEYLIDSDVLNEADNYWAGAECWVWVHAQNNSIQSRRITASSQSAHTITFEEPLTAAIATSGYTLPDAYSIYNHPHLLDTAGEFYYTPQPDSTGEYWIYAWPRNPANLDAKMGINDLVTGVLLRSGSANYVTVSGLEIRGYCGNWTRSGGVICPSGVDHTGFWLQDCYIHHNHGDGVDVYNGTDDVFEDNLIDWNTEYGLGVMGGHKNVLVKGNRVLNTERTSIVTRSVKRGVFIHNTVDGFLGTHGNGLAIYDGCDDVLVAGNRFAVSRNVPLTFNTMHDIVICNNVFYSKTTNYVTATWADGTGYHLVFNNLIIGDDTQNASALETTGDKVYRNNIVGGGNIVGDSGAIDMTHNLYTAFAWNQHTLDATEIDARDLPFSDLFVDSAALDFRPADGSPLIDAGTSVQDMIDAYALVDSFPEYDFTKDIAGNARSIGSSWDIGPYEYGTDNIQHPTSNIQLPSPFSIQPNPVRSLQQIPGQVFSLMGQDGNGNGVYLVRDERTGVMRKVILIK